MVEFTVRGTALGEVVGLSQPARHAPRERSYVALRTGVVAAAASVAPSFARGLLPRSMTDQAVLTGATAAYWLGTASLGLSAVQAVAELIVAARQSGSPENATLAAAGVIGAAATATIAVVPDTHTTSLPLAAAQSGAWILGGGALATTLVIGSDKLLRATVGERGLPTNLAAAAAVGGVVSALRVGLRDRRARRYGEPEDRAAIQGAGGTGVLRAVGTGAAVSGGLVGLAAAHFAVAEGTTALVSHALGRGDRPVTPLVGHATAAAGLGAAAAVALERLRKRLMHADDVIEAAYPEKPTNPAVTAGPNSRVAFDQIGKEGRRFVLMTLTPEQISEVMGEPASAPVRAVAGFSSARSAEDRARIAIEELEALGAFQKGTIVVAAPTGVGYVNYSFAEALEYLTRGDCAILVPQYALVPSALALHLTKHGIAQQRLVLAAIRDRIRSMPSDQRPRLLQFGESLGAQVALDVAADGTDAFDELGIEHGLYLGTPFRTALWSRWFRDPDVMDPAGTLASVTRADRIALLPEWVHHVQVIHDDDPINKFDYASIIRAPWWMGPPLTRPPGVPRETKFRPVITFIISLVDLKNGMNSKPGEFVRVGHDYRIELREAVQRTFRLPATAEQEERIEQALRDREREWATRRLIASRFARARDSVRSTLARWGQSADSLDLDEETVAALSRGEAAALALARVSSSSSSA